MPAVEGVGWMMQFVGFLADFMVQEVSFLPALPIQVVSFNPGTVNPSEFGCSRLTP